MPEISGYQVLSFIGSGACGRVWEVEESLTGIRRAIKTLPKAGEGRTFDPARELAGIREYQRKSKGHPNLIQIFHVDQTESCYFYAMELADPEKGRPHYQPRTLESVIQHEAPMAPAQALDILSQ